MSTKFEQYVEIYGKDELYEETCRLLRNRNFRGVIKGDAGAAYFDDHGGISIDHVYFAIRSICSFYKRETIPNTEVEEAIFQLFRGSDSDVVLTIKYWIYYLKDYRADELCENKSWMLNNNKFINQLSQLLPKLCESEYFSFPVTYREKIGGRVCKIKIPYIKKLVLEINECLDGNDTIPFE